MGIGRLSRITRRYSILSAAYSHRQHPAALSPNDFVDSRRHPRSFSEFHGNSYFQRRFDYSRLLGGHHVLFQSSCFSNVASKENEKENKTSNGNDGGGSSWIDVYLPRKARPFALLARLDKPIGTWLLAWPCMWSITMAAAPGSFPDAKMMVLFGTGALLLRGAGCTINDLLDRDIDTKPQAYLGLTFNWGALLGWAAVKESLDPAVVLPLYASGVLWTLVYDTIYAHQDKEDDLRVGVKSTALRFGDSSKKWITGFGIACITSLALSGYNANLAWPYFSFLMAASSQLAWQIMTVDLSSRVDCNKKFVSNKWFGAIVYCGILFGKLLS
ncbi:4-hydroxybenzoate polyprenyltransferase, mitochondrial isoform X2 [Primulina tabacum]|uniref:4-hydroxybenzoate polyprenyltransferase, mitochondrial isoform X2 n=1 Tax=Primulina tabacum TaxID=48773 RepID=UPI003F5A75B8